MLECSKQKFQRVQSFRSFEFGTFDIVSDFVLRISDFQIPLKDVTTWTPMPVKYK